MAATVIARQGDTVDLIAARCYDGDTSMVAAIYEANPGLATFGPILPHGTAVILPERVAAPAAATVNLWD